MRHQFTTGHNFEPSASNSTEVFNLSKIEYLSDEHARFLESLNAKSINFGWAQTENTITSKLYDGNKVLIATSLYSNSREIKHSVEDY